MAAGYSANSGTSLDFTVIKSSGGDGATLWHTEIDLGGADQAWRVALDPSGDVVAVGTLTMPGFAHAVVKLDGSDGSELWRVVMPSEFLNAVTADSAGNAIAVGYRFNGISADFLAIKLDATTGAELWRREIDGSAGVEDVALDAAVAGGGDVVVAGHINDGSAAFTVMRLDGATGATVWRQDLSGTAAFGTDRATAVSIDPTGDVFATGALENNSTGGDFAVVKLAGASGAELWRTSVDGPSFTDEARDLVVDASGNPVVQGLIGASIHVVKLSGTTGGEQWRRAREGVVVNDSVGLAVDPAGDVFVAEATAPFYRFGVSKLAGATGTTAWHRHVSGVGQGGYAYGLAAAGSDVVAVGDIANPDGLDFAVYRLSGADGTVGPLFGKTLRATDKAGDATKRKLVVQVRDSAVAAPLAGSADDPTTAGGKLRMVNPGTMETATFNLPAGSWRGLGNPPGSKGYKYSDAATVNGPCKTVLVKPGKTFKAFCKATSSPIAFSLDEATQASLTLSLQLGLAEPQCANFVGTIARNQGTGNPGPLGIFVAKDARAFSGDCPVP